jgi:hypothetical protein
MASIKSNELKKGSKIVMKDSGWHGTIEDNKKGDIRMACIHGISKDIGSIYVHDIDYAIIDGVQYTIELTPNQTKLQKLVNNLF